MFDVNLFSSMGPDLQRTASFCSHTRRSASTIWPHEHDSSQERGHGRRPSTSSSTTSSSGLSSSSYESMLDAEDQSPLMRIRRRRPSLRRTKCPVQGSLRELRAMQSEACLKQVYERQTLAYLDGTIDFRPSLGSVHEDPD